MAGNANKTLIDSDEIDALLDTMSTSCAALLSSQTADAVMVGIHTGGVWVADALHHRMSLDIRPSRLNANYHRDDYSRVGLKSGTPASDMPISLQDKCIILVDDVLHTGRTIRAAMNQLFEYGRPANVRLVTLFSRPGHELPIAADIVGKHVDCEDHIRLRLSGPKPLQLFEERTR